MRVLVRTPAPEERHRPPAEGAIVKRIAILVPALAGCVLLAKRRARRAGRTDFAKRMAAKPDGTPAKWIFDNVTAIRQNTERLLELLEQPTPAAGEAPMPNLPRD